MLICKAVTVKDMGGISVVFGNLLDAFWNASGHNFATAGVRLHMFDNSSLQLYARYETLLADEAALHAAFMCKGSAGFRPCLLCSNVYNARTTRAIARGDVPHTCVDPDACTLHSEASLRAVASALSRTAATGTKAQLEEHQTAIGWNFAPSSVLWTERWMQKACPTYGACFDWMHVFFIAGIFNVHLGHLLHALNSAGVSPAALSDYIAEWTWPKLIGSKTGVDVFGPKRVKGSWSEWQLRATASEALSLTPVIANFMQGIIDRPGHDARLAPHAACLLLLAHIVELLQLCGRCSKSQHA